MPVSFYQMKKAEKKQRRWKRKIILSILLLSFLYLLSTVGYYLLPWSVRKPIHKSFPRVNRALCVRGFNMMNRLDGLGFGSDVAVDFHPKLKSKTVYGGLPTSYCFTPRILKNKSYTEGYSDPLKNPYWVAYQIFKVDDLEHGKRPGFRIDRRTLARVRPSDYTHSGYDRGHMAPNFAIATRYGSAGQRETFLMSNVVPQKPWINRHIWKDLEMLVSKKYSMKYQEVWVITGPIFKKPIKRLKSGVAIPSAYYKILIDVKSTDKIRVLAFLIPGKIPPYTRLKTCLVSVDEIEELTQLDFFPNLSLTEQEELESHVSRIWPWWGPLTFFD